MHNQVGFLYLVGVVTCLWASWSAPSCSRSFGLAAMVDCPQQHLEVADVDATFRRGTELCNEGRSGEYFMHASLERGLPLLRTAALHGHVDAIELYRSLLTQAAIVDMQSIGGLSFGDAAAEALMWELVMIHRGYDEVPNAETQRYAVLLNPTQSIPDNYYDDTTGLGWSFQMMTDQGVRWARMQAFMWRGCW